MRMPINPKASSQCKSAGRYSMLAKEFFDESSEEDSDIEIDRKIIERASRKIQSFKGQRVNAQEYSKEIESMEKIIQKQILKKTEKMKKQRREIFKIESSHFKHKKFVLILCSAAILMMNFLLRGRTTDSIFQIKQCSIGDWVSFLLLGC